MGEDFQKKIEDALANGDPIPAFPESPVSPGDEMAIAFRSAYEDFRGQEFSDRQALYLAACVILQTPGAAPRE